RLVKRQVLRVLDFSDFARAPRPLVQQLHALPANLINAAPPVSDLHQTPPRPRNPPPASSSHRKCSGHCAASRREIPRRPASLSRRTCVRSASAAESTVPAFSISLTSAEPTTAASASPPSIATCAGCDTPNPTASGRSVSPRVRRTRSGTSAARASFAPVTPVREIRYKKPEEAAAIFASL